MYAISGEMHIRISDKGDTFKINFIIPGFKTKEGAENAEIRLHQVSPCVVGHWLDTEVVENPSYSTFNEQEEVVLKLSIDASHEYLFEMALEAYSLKIRQQYRKGFLKVGVILR